MANRPPDWDEPCYAIGVAARIVNLHPQTLRNYESLGLIRPARVSGRRRYSLRDIARLQKIAQLTELGVNLAGVEMILRLSEQLEELQREMRRMQAEYEAEIARLQQMLG